MARARVLIVDDEAKIGEMLARALDSDDISATYCQDPEWGLRILKEETVDLIISDLRMPRIDGFELLSRAKAIQPACEVIVMTAYATVAIAREALKRGAADFITKPFSIEKELKPLVRDLLGHERDVDNERSRVRHRDSDDLGPRVQLASRIGRETALDEVIGRGPAMTKLLASVKKIARSDSPTLLLGESGSGKEVVANLIHELSARSAMPFIKINCAALPESLLESELFGYSKGAFTGADRDRDGLFQAAHRGTLLLDEIGEISLSFQPKLLRVLQDGEFHRIGDPRGAKRVDVRVIASTNRDLEEAIARGTFREDLFYRLNVVPLEVPPLRSHIEDLEELIERFADLLSRDEPIEFSPEAIELMRSYPWPGNIRELQNAVEYAVVLKDGRRVEVEDLPVGVQDFERLRRGAQRPGRVTEGTLESIERRCILQAMEKTAGNQTQASRLLGVTRRTLGYRIAKYRLEADIEERLAARESPEVAGKRKMSRVRNRWALPASSVIQGVPPSDR